VATPPHVPQPETELEEFFDLSRDPLSIIGFDGEFKRVNASFLRLLGYTKPELFSRSALEITHPDDAEPAREALAQLAVGRDVVQFEGRVVCADGSVRWLEWSTRSMPERGVVYCVGRDTTERRRIEAELREAQRLLETGREEPRADIVAHALEPAEVRTFCPYKGIASYYNVGDARNAAWSYRAPFEEMDRITELVSFYPEKLTITIDGEKLEPVSGQNVVPHGPDRNLSVDEVGGIQLVEDAAGTGA
jgi:PAS domain S-box-containing protein